MSENSSVRITRDDVSPALRQVVERMGPSVRANAVGAACVKGTQYWLESLLPNRRGWPSQGFYKACSAGTDYRVQGSSAIISIDNEKAPGAIRHQFYGGRINAKDKKLTIPAGPQFYGRRAGDFTDLRLAVFGRGGPAALVVRDGGTGTVNFRTGKGRHVKGAGVRAVARAHHSGRELVAFWLRDFVDQDAKPEVIPPDDMLKEVAVAALEELAKQNGLT